MVLSVGVPPGDPLAVLGATRLLSSLSTDALRRVADEVEWLVVPGGAVVFRQGDPPDGVYFIVGGRLRVSIEDGDAGERRVNELGRGQYFGELGLLIDAPRSATVRAVRDSSLARLSVDAFNLLVRAEPEAMLALSRNVARMLVSAQTGGPPVAGVTTVAVIGLVGPSDAAELLSRLSAAVGGQRHVRRLDAADVDAHALSQAIDGEEASGGMVVINVGLDATDRAVGCLRQSDRVLVVVDGRSRPSLAGAEALLAAVDASGVSPSVELVLLQPSGIDRPRGTARWLALRHFEIHHHVRRETAGDPDVARLGRHLLGQSVGLVLGGGGARCFAEIGAYRALRDAGVAIDRVGGSSLGAIMSAQVAAGWSPERMHEENGREWRIARINRRMTVPLVSLLSVRTAVPMLDRMFGDADLEDLWIPCFATTVDLSSCRLAAHSRGLVARWVRASASPPGIWPPVVGDDGHLHVDGGVLDNLPVQVMHQGSVGRIVTVNVSPYQAMAVDAGGEVVGGAALLRQLVRTRGRLTGPNIVKILYRTAIVTSLGVQASARAMSDVYVEPDVGHISLTDYDAIDETVEIGYKAMQEALAAAGDGAVPAARTVE